MKSVLDTLLIVFLGGVALFGLAAIFIFSHELISFFTSLDGDDDE